jgi:hypothetical protein
VFHKGGFRDDIKLVTFAQLCGYFNKYKSHANNC